MSRPRGFGGLSEVERRRMREQFAGLKEDAGRCCRACGRTLAQGEGVWYGRRAEPDSLLVKCADCDYEDYRNSPGGM
jgi:hypothetical protein